MTTVVFVGENNGRSDRWGSGMRASLRRVRRKMLARKSVTARNTEFHMRLIVARRLLGGTARRG